MRYAVYMASQLNLAVTEGNEVKMTPFLDKIILVPLKNVKFKSHKVYHNTWLKRVPLGCVHVRIIVKL